MNIKFKLKKRNHQNNNNFDTNHEIKIKSLENELNEIANGPCISSFTQ